MTTKTDPQLIIDRMKIRLEELQEQMPVIAELEARIKDLEAYGWRWCKNELPEKEGKYIVQWDTGNIDWDWFYKTGFKTCEVTQWFKLPEALKEAQNDE